MAKIPETTLVRDANLAAIQMIVCRLQRDAAHLSPETKKAPPRESGTGLVLMGSGRHGAGDPQSTRL